MGFGVKSLILQYFKLISYVSDTFSAANPVCDCGGYSDLLICKRATFMIPALLSNSRWPQ